MTSTLLAQTALRILSNAAMSEHGLIVRVISGGTNGVMPSMRARQILWRFRAESMDERLRDLQIRLSPDDPQNEIWIIKQIGAGATGTSEQPRTLLEDI